MKLRETQIRLDFFALPILSCSRRLIPVHQCQYFCCWYKWLTILPRLYWLWSKENPKVFNLQNTKAQTLFIHVTLKDSTCYWCTIESIQSVCGSVSHPGPLQVDRPEDPLWFHPPQPYTSQKHQQQQMEEEFLATSHHWAAEILDCLHQGWAAPGLEGLQLLELTLDQHKWIKWLVHFQASGELQDMLRSHLAV